MKNYTKSLLAVMALFILAGCTTLKNINIGSDFEKSAKGYVQLVRWQELESAADTYVTPSLQEEYRKKIAEAGEVKIVDYRVRMMTCDPVKGEGTVKVEFDYYRPPSLKVLTVNDTEKWSYENDNDRRIWRLQSLLPQFK